MASNIYFLFLTYDDFCITAAVRSLVLQELPCTSLLILCVCISNYIPVDGSTTRYFLSESSVADDFMGLMTYFWVSLAYNLGSRKFLLFGKKQREKKAIC